MLAMLIGTADLSFISLKVALPLADCHTVSSKQNLLGAVSCTLFKWSGWNRIWWWSQWGWTKCNFRLRFYLSREITTVLQNNLNNFYSVKPVYSPSFHCIPTIFEGLQTRINQKWTYSSKEVDLQDFLFSWMRNLHRKYYNIGLHSGAF